MEQFTQLFEAVGLDIKTCLWVSGAVYLLVESIKAKFPSLHGQMTQLVAGVIAIAISILVVAPNWLAAVVLAVVSWLAPDGLHQVRFANQKRTDRIRVRQMKKVKQDGITFRSRSVT